MPGRVNRTVLICLVTAFVGAAAPARAAGPDFGLFSDVQALVAEGSFNQAEARLESAFLASQAEPLPDRVALLELLAEVQSQAGAFADLGDTHMNRAQLVERMERQGSPALSPIYEAAGDAYRAAGANAQAIDAYERALDVDRRYLDCESNTLARHYANLSSLHWQSGDTRKAAEYRVLADDPVARCSRAGPGGATRQIKLSSAAATGQDDYDQITIYYGTDRARTGSDRPQDFYGAGRGGIEYGRINVSIPHSHKPGAVESPSLVRLEWREDPARHIVLLDIETLSEEALFDNIRTRLGANGSDELFVFVHGYNVEFADAAKRTAQLANDLNFEGAPVLYSWPAAGSTFAYLSDAAVVELSARRLTVFLEDIVNRSGAKRIHLIAHSMGNRALVEALELMSLRMGDDLAGPVFEQVIFAAPDVDAGLFAEVADDLKRLARRLTLYTSDADLALAASRKLHGNAPRAGQGGADILVAAGVDSVDMSEVGKDMMGHSYFASDTSALTDILWLFWRDIPPASRCGMLRESGGKGEYWVYRPDECDSEVVRSALTLARREGRAALARASAIIDRLRSARSLDATQRRDLEDWTLIREAVAKLLNLP